MTVSQLLRKETQKYCTRPLFRLCVVWSGTNKGNNNKIESTLARSNHNWEGGSGRSPIKMKK